MQTARLFDPESVPSAQPTQAATVGGITGGDVIRRYLEDLEYRRLTGQVSGEHAANYTRSLSAAPRYDGAARYVGFIEIVGERPIAALAQYDLSEWLKRNPQWASRETRRRNLAAALACFRWAKEEAQLIPVCPYSKTKRLKEPRVTRREATDSETAKVWAAASEELRRILWFVDATGCRTCEARELLWTDIDWEIGVCRIVKHKTRNSGDVVRPRFVGLPTHVLAELRRWHARRKDQARVFVTRRGKPWSKNNLSNRLALLCAKLGLPDDLTPYCFRHRFATLSVAAGLPERDVADQMGHSGTDTLKVYAHTLTAHRVADVAEASAQARAELAGRPKRPRLEVEDCPLFGGLADG